MSLVVPSIQTINLWFNNQRDILLGSPKDVIRKIKIFKDQYLLKNGIEILLIPSRIQHLDQFDAAFCTEIAKLKYKTVHIGDVSPNFLTESEIIVENMVLLSKILERFEVDTIILHAHHLKKKRFVIKKLFSEILPNITICIENNGFDDAWGQSIEALKEIFHDCPDFKFCLDIAHVKDFKHFTLGDLIAVNEIRSRIKEIHFSYSTRMLSYDPYAKNGYPGYKPLHALFSLCKIKPSRNTIKFIRKFPIVIEGVIPFDNGNLKFFKDEVELLFS